MSTATLADLTVDVDADYRVGFEEMNVRIALDGEQFVNGSSATFIDSTDNTTAATGYGYSLSIVDGTMYSKANGTDNLVIDVNGFDTLATNEGLSYAEVKAGLYLTVAVTTDGRIVNSGASSCNDTNNPTGSPELINSITAPVVQLEIYSRNWVAIDEDGYVWVCDRKNPWGIHVDATTHNTPNMVNIPGTAVDIVTGGRARAILTADGSLYINGHHQVANSTGSYVATGWVDMTEVFTGETVKDIELGANDQIIVNTDVAVYGNYFGTYFKDFMLAAFGIDETVDVEEYSNNFYPFLVHADYVVLAEIVSVEPTNSYNINGTDFGDEMGVITIAGVVLDVISWTDTQVHVENPLVDMTGFIEITRTDGTTSNLFMATLLADAAPETEVVPEVVVVPVDNKCKRGHGYGDKNHCHVHQSKAPKAKKRGRK